jgi:protein-S-isoprenylcysteine O-methyltransferase Ste14
VPRADGAGSTTGEPVRPPSRVRPPTVAFAAAVLAFAIDRWIATPEVVPAPARPWGLALVGAGAALAAWGLATFHAHHTTHHPFGAATSLVTTVPYRCTRNPMYVGLASILVGIAAWRGTLAWGIAPLAFFAFAALLQVPYEERRLEAAFGDSYRDYRRRVRRWL